MEKNIIFIEEHNEAFKEIYNFCSLKREKYTLLHIDEHDDMGYAYVKKKDIDFINNESLGRIVYNQLNVGNYILPLIYKGVLTDIIWLSNEPIESYCEIQTTIKSKNNGFIVIGQKKVKPDGKNFGYLKINSSSNVQFIRNQKIIVSLDLDYFGSNDEKGEELLIEISKEEYYNLKNNQYHKLRLGLGSMIHFFKKNNKYYLQTQTSHLNKRRCTLKIQ